MGSRPKFTRVHFTKPSFHKQEQNKGNFRMKFLLSKMLAINRVNVRFRFCVTRGKLLRENLSFLDQIAQGRKHFFAYVRMHCTLWNGLYCALPDMRTSCISGRPWRLTSMACGKSWMTWPWLALTWRCRLRASLRSWPTWRRTTRR